MSNPVISEILSDDIVYDPFGTALSWQFQIADVLSTRGMVPAAWGYSSPLGPDETADRFEWLSSLPSDQLIQAGEVCKTLVEISHEHGMSY
jgi:hypothetical protein